jgi:hypothetical protein
VQWIELLHKSPINHLMGLLFYWLTGEYANAGLGAVCGACKPFLREELSYDVYLIFDLGEVCYTSDIAL